MISPTEEDRKKRKDILVLSVLLLLLTTISGWFLKEELHNLVSKNPSLVPAVALSLSAWMSLGGVILIAMDAVVKEQVRERIIAQTKISPLYQPFAVVRWIKRLPDPIEWLFQPMLRTRWGQRRQVEWEQAGLGTHPSRYLLMMFGAGFIGGLFGLQVGSLPLAWTLAGLAALAPYRWVSRRVRRNHQQFSEQAPFALDALAAGISAGLSLQQSIEFAVEELPQPIASSLAVIVRKMRLGHSIEEVLKGWAETHSDEGLRLAVDGILLQRQLGGDLVAMLQKAAEVSRERIALQREVQAVTAQGRLSGWVIAGLVPVSAALLLATNPAYIDILFNTLLGQTLLVIALALQLMGWFVISRLIRVVH